jgi:hypothetical protein
MSNFKDLKGIFGSLFQFRLGSGPQVKDNSDVIEFRNAADDNYVIGRVLRLGTSPGINDIATKIDSETKVIEYSFAGATPPSAGDNTGKYGFCHTTGGSYTAADVIYDTGAALLVVPRASCKIIATNTSAVSGTVSLNASGVYAWVSTAYILVGDGSSAQANTLQAIKVAITHATGATADSTATIPDGAVVVRVICDVTTLFNTAATVAVTANGSSPVTLMSTAQNDLTKANQYEVEDAVAITSTGAGVVRCTYTDNSASAGAADIYVFYVIPSA